jgi:hypothetical protein
MLGTIPSLTMRREEGEGDSMPTESLITGFRRSQKQSLRDPSCLRALCVSVPSSPRAPVSPILIIFGWRYQKRGSTTPELDHLRVALSKMRVPRIERDVLPLALVKTPLPTPQPVQRFDDLTIHAHHPTPHNSRANHPAALDFTPQKRTLPNSPPRPGLHPHRAPTQ